MNRPYVTSRQLAALGATATPREWLVLSTLRRIRLASAGQLERICFADTSDRRARQVLAALTDRRLVLRLPRVIGGVRAGSAGFVYALDIAGLRLVAPGRPARRLDDPGSRFLAHRLAVTETYARLVEADRSGLLELTDFTAEPQCWRPFIGAQGRAVLKPDAALVTRLGTYEDRWFIEVDRATEGLAVLKTKCEQYRRYWQSGTEQARFEVFPRVLWLVPDEARRDALIGVLGRMPAETWPLFTVALQDEAVSRIVQGAHL